MRKRQRNLPKSLRNQCKVQKNIKTGEDQKVFRNDHDELLVKNCPEKEQTNNQQPRFKKTT